MKRRKLAPGAPSAEAHAALVDAVLTAIRRTDPRLEPLIKLEWFASRSFLGTACVVLPGMAHARGVTYPESPKYATTPDLRSAFERVVRRKVQWAPRMFAQVRVSSVLWCATSAVQRADTIAHELAHLSHMLDRVAAGKLPVPPRGQAHGSAWQAWVVRYAGRPGAVRVCRDEFVPEPDLTAIAPLPLF